MIRISLSYVYYFATALEPLTTIKAGDKCVDRWFELLMAQNGVDEFLNRSVFAQSIRTSRQTGNQLLNEIAALIKIASDPANVNKQFDAPELGGLNYMVGQFKTILLAEMETLNAHYVTAKRGYDTLSLMSNAEVIFPPDLPTKVPGSVFDIREAGKCIAFELPTAAGFHLHRANEAILHLYYDAVTAGKPRPKTRNIGDYLGKLKEFQVGDARLITALTDLKDMHRNPLIHPDQTLENIDEAIALMGSIHNAVVYMLKAIPIPPPKPLAIPTSAS